MLVSCGLPGGDEEVIDAEQGALALSCYGDMSKHDRGLRGYVDSGSCYERRGGAGHWRQTLIA